MVQVIDKAHIAVQQTGLYELAIPEWNGFNSINKNWPDLKIHFGEVYNTRLRSRAGTVNSNGYHGAANATDITNDGSISLMQENFSDIQLANNANFQVTNDNMSVLSEVLQTIRAVLVATQ